MDGGAGMMKKEIDLTEDSEIVDESNECNAAVDVDETQSDVLVLPKNARLNKDNSVTLKLRREVAVKVKTSLGELRTDTFDQLTFHPLTGGDLRAISQVTGDMQNIVIFARATRIREQVMNVLYDKLDAADVVDGGEIISAFIGGGRLKKS